ncbi:hypothetical protein B7463_g7090, partial [Scytalidium lignicola]
MASPAVHFLSAQQVMRLHNIFINSAAKPSQLSMPESATHSPMNLEYYEQQQDIFQLAANLATKIMKNNAFQDGNKRTALTAVSMFLKLNGYQLDENPSTTELADAHVAACTNQWTVEDLGRYYASKAKVIPK